MKLSQQKLDVIKLGWRQPRSFAFLCGFLHSLNLLQLHSQTASSQSGDGFAVLAPQNLDRSCVTDSANPDSFFSRLNMKLSSPTKSSKAPPVAGNGQAMHCAGVWSEISVPLAASFIIEASVMLENSVTLARGFEAQKIYKVCPKQFDPHAQLLPTRQSTAKVFRVPSIEQ